MYHVEPELMEVTKPSSATMVRPLLFLSRMLSPVEIRYWPTELEVAYLIWTVKKAKHLIEASNRPP